MEKDIVPVYCGVCSSFSQETKDRRAEGTGEQQLNAALYYKLERKLEEEKKEY